MLITGIKSRPIYDRLAPIGRAHRHLVVAQGSGGAAVERLLAELEGGSGSTTLLYSSESFSGRDFSERLKNLPVAESRFYADNAELLHALREVLEKTCMGTVLYLAGSETFLARAMQVANAFDLKSDEVLREHCGSLARTVVCMHCQAMNEQVTRRVFACWGCGEALVVRDHYSQRLGAFMGVKADAEAPGEFPPDEELDT